MSPKRTNKKATKKQVARAKAKPAARKASKSGDAAPRKAAGRRKATPPPAEAAPESRPPDSDDQRDEPPELGIGSRMVPFAPWEPREEDDALASSLPDDDALEGDVAAQIRALEARLDGMIRRAGEEAPPPSLRAQVGSAARGVVDRLGAPLPLETPGTEDGGVGDAVRELFSSDYYLRQWGRLGMRNRSEEVDEFGLDPTYEARLRPLFDFLYQRYFRVETSGLEHVPAAGRCLVVANHSGTLPMDGVMLRTALRLEHPSRRDLRWLAEDFVYYLPFVGSFINRIGAVRACQENAERLLRHDELVAVFPEGVKGTGKLYRERYRLQRFGRGGFIRLCLRTQTPLVPCAIVGAEEAMPLLHRVEVLSKAVGLPYIPVTPTFPLLGPLGLIPAPTKWKLRFGEPIRFEGYGPEAAGDHVLVGRFAERVRSTIQGMVDETVARRESVWFG